MNSTAFGVLSFLMHVVHRDAYEGLIFVSSPNPLQVFEENGRSLIEGVSKATMVPLISLTYTSSVNITENFNGPLLTVVDLQTPLLPKILAKVALFLHLTAKTRVLFVLDHDGPDDDFLEQLFTACWRWKLVNIIAVFRDVAETQEFQSYAPYPTLHSETKPISSSLYPDRVVDLHGSALKVFADQIAPLDMMTQKPNGEIELSGYVGHIITAFARKHNATLNFAIPYEVGKSVFFAGLRELLFNDTLDLLISLTVINVSCVIYSYTVEQTAYCMMLPVERNVPTFEFYVIVMDGPVLVMTCCVCLLLSILLVVVSHHLDKRRRIHLMDILLNDSCIRGLLSQSFNVLKSSSSILMLIYFLLSLMGMYFTTWFLAYLQTYLTHPPRKRRIETWDDLPSAEFKVNLFWKEFLEAHDLVLELMDESVIVVSGSYTGYLELLDNLNTRYAYVIQLSKWNTFKGQQALFARPLFRLSQRMCLMVGMQMGFPIHPNSVLRDALNRVIMQVRDSGLLQHWMDTTFYELVRVGRMNFSDWSSSDDGFKQLQVTDLSWVFAVFVVAHGVCVVVFAMELLAHRMRRWKVWMKSTRRGEV